MVVIDTAHGHSKQVRRRGAAPGKRETNRVQIVAGNVATYDGARALIDAGADAIKVGIGPGSICTTRIVAGVGVPQLTAIADAVRAADGSGVPVIADGGIKYLRRPGQGHRAWAPPRAMMGSMFAGTDEAPGEVFLYQGRSYKSYRGMGSLGAMARGSADRYFQKEVEDAMKLVPEGIEGQTPYKGPISPVIHQLVGGLRAAMGYVGAADIASFQERARFIRITGAGLRESHVHDVMITREAPNYSERGLGRMRDGGRLAAAIEVLADMEERHKPARMALKAWGESARYAGAKDRAFVSGLVLDVLRRRRRWPGGWASRASRRASGRPALRLGLAGRADRGGGGRGRMGRAR